MADLQAGPASEDDVEGIVALSEAVFGADAMTTWRPHHVRSHLDAFPEGQLVVRVDGDLVASSTAMRAHRDAVDRPHTWMSLTGGSELPNHDPDGEVLYGLEIQVHPDNRGQGLAGLIYEARKALVRSTGMEELVVGARVAGYDEARLATGISVEDYVGEVVQGKREDPVLSMQLSLGLEPDGLLENYVSDPASWHHAVRLRWAPG